MTLQQTIMLLCAGSCAAGGQFSITAAYYHAPASKISIYDYSQILFSTLFPTDSRRSIFRQLQINPQRRQEPCVLARGNRTALVYVSKIADAGDAFLVKSVCAHEPEAIPHISVHGRPPGSLAFGVHGGAKALRRIIMTAGSIEPVPGSGI